MKLLGITYTVQTGNRDERVHVAIADDGEWQQWGAPREVLGFTVPLTEALAAAVLENPELLSPDTPTE